MFLLLHSQKKQRHSINIHEHYVSSLHHVVNVGYRYLFTFVKALQLLATGRLLLLYDSIYLFSYILPQLYN